MFMAITLLDYILCLWLSLFACCMATIAGTKDSDDVYRRQSPHLKSVITTTLREQLKSITVPSQF